MLETEIENMPTCGRSLAYTRACGRFGGRRWSEARNSSNHIRKYGRSHLSTRVCTNVSTCTHIVKCIQISNSNIYGALRRKFIYAVHSFKFKSNSLEWQRDNGNYTPTATATATASVVGKAVAAQVSGHDAQRLKSSRIEQT